MIESNDPQRKTVFTVVFRRLRRLPKLEIQTLECFRILADFGAEFRTPYTATFDLKPRASRLYAHCACWIYNGLPLWGFTVANIAIPDRLWDRSWFRAFSDVVFHTMPHDLLLFQGVNPRLDCALRQKPEYHRLRGNWFVRSEEIAAGSFQPLMLSSSDCEEFVKNGEPLHSTELRPTVTDFPGFRKPLAGWRRAASHDRARKSGPVRHLRSGTRNFNRANESSESRGYLLHCHHGGSSAHIEGVHRMADAHPDESLWLQLCEVWEQAKRRPDPLSARVLKWREEFNKKQASLC